MLNFRFNVIKISLFLSTGLMFQCFAAGILKAQDTAPTVDEQFELARNVAFTDGDYEKARELAYSALQRSPDYHGIRIFIASLYGWEGRYEDAKGELGTVLEIDPGNRLALISIIDIESRSGNSPGALEWASEAQGYFPEDPEFVMKEAAVYYSTENYRKAEDLYRSILSRDPTNAGARVALKSVKLNRMKHTASLSYRYDRFSRIFDPWNFMELSLSRKTNLGSVIGRVQYANRFATTGAQFSMDAYPSIYRGLYAYISGGYSDSSIYPGTRFGLSLYKSLPRAMELEGGIRYLKFSASETTIYTFSLTKYRGSYMFTGRTYIVPYTGERSQSFSLLTRRYFGDASTYVGFSGGFGSAPSEVQFAEDLNRLTSWSLSAETQYPLGRRVLVGASAGFDSEEFTNFTRDRVSVRAFLSYKF